MIEIDGAHGEGGGQLVRTAVAAMRGLSIRIVDIRARRPVPGLAAQHLAAVRAVAALCDARCDGLELRSTTLSFEPRRLHGGDFTIDVGTAGSIALVVQAMLAAAVASGERVTIALRGGTHIRAAPAIDYVDLVCLPLLARMGVQAELSVARRGYYSKGGGEATLVVHPVARLMPFTVDELGPVACIEARVHVVRLVRQIAERMQAAAQAELAPGMPLDAVIDVGETAMAFGPGGAIVLRACAERTVLGASRVAQRGVPAERLGREAARELMDDLQAGATLDVVRVVP